MLVAWSAPCRAKEQWEHALSEVFFVAHADNVQPSGGVGLRQSPESVGQAPAAEDGLVLLARVRRHSGESRSTHTIGVRDR